MLNREEHIEHMRRMKEDPEYRKEIRRKALLEILQDWKKMKPMKVRADIPELPVVDKNEWINVFVPILIEKGAIAKKDLEDGEWYYGDHRNCGLAKWDKKENEFKYIRTKFQWVYWDCCKHFEDDDGYALFVPIRKATDVETVEEIKRLPA